MLESSRRVCRTALLISLALYPAASFAGTGRLVSHWMSRAPRIDATIEAGEWDEATSLDLGHGVIAHIGNDGRTLYVGVLDPRGTVPSLNRVILFLEDEGGAQPVLDDDAWTTAACQSNPELGEGEIWFYYLTEAVSFYEWRTNGGVSSFCPGQELESRVGYAVNFALGPWGVTYEIAVPLDGPGPLHATPGRELGFELRVLDETGGNDLCYPDCVIDPPSFRNLILASGGCNTGPITFESGLPLDSTDTIDSGSGTGWQISSQFADPVFCQENVTGGTGVAACVSNAFYTATNSSATLHLPLSLAAQATAEIRLLANFQQGASFDALVLGVTDSGNNPDTFVLWQSSSHGDPSGPGVAVSIALDLNSPLFATYHPIDFFASQSTISGGGQEGGIAEIDDFEVRCGPILFADGFESRLTTHWSATIP